MHNGARQVTPSLEGPAMIFRSQSIGMTAALATPNRGAARTLFPRSRGLRATFRSARGLIDMLQDIPAILGAD